MSLVSPSTVSNTPLKTETLPRRARKRYYQLPRDERQRRTREKNRRARALLDENPELKEEAKARANLLKRRNRQQTQQAKIHNSVYRHDPVAETPRQRAAEEKTLMFGRLATNFVRIPQRLRTMEGSVTHDELGHHNEGGHYVEVRTSSMVRVSYSMHSECPRSCGFSFVNCPITPLGTDVHKSKLSEALWSDSRNRKIVSLDAGSGNGLPSIIFSQFLFDHGFHVGMEQCPGLLSNSITNIKELTAKGMVSLLARKFDRESVLEVGELGDNVPPRCHFVLGDIVSGLRKM